MSGDRTPVNVIGPGAVGLGIAVLVARSGRNVALLGKEGAIPSARLHYNGDEINVVFPSDREYAGAITLITSKAYDLDSVLARYSATLASSACIVYLQNGLGLAEKFIGYSKSIQGILWVSAERLDQYYSNWITGLRIVLDGRNSLAAGIEHVLTEAGIAIVIAKDFQVEIFKKLMVNLACNPVSALYRIPNAEIHQHPEARRRAIQAAEEIGRLAAMAGHPVDLDPTQIVDGMATKLGEFKSSTLQDREAGRQLELEAIMLEPIKLATKYRCEMPTVIGLYKELMNISNR